MFKFSLGGGKQKSSSRSYVDPNQSPYLGDIYSRSKNLSTGSTFTGLDPFQKQAQEMALNYANQLPSMYGDVTGANNFMLGAADLKNNPYIKDYATAAIDPLKQALLKDILPRIGADFGNNFSSSRKDLQYRRAMDDFTNQAGNVTAGIMNNAYNTGLTATNQGINNAQMIANLGLMPSQITAGVGEQNRAIEQERLLDPMKVMEWYKQIIGDPTILSKGKSSAWNFDMSSER